MSDERSRFPANTAGHPEHARQQTYAGPWMPAGADGWPDRASSYVYPDPEAPYGYVAPIRLTSTDPADHVLPADEDRPALPDEEQLRTRVAGSPAGRAAASMAIGVALANTDNESWAAAGLRAVMTHAERRPLSDDIGRQLGVLQRTVGELITYVAAREPLGADVLGIVTERIRGLMTPAFSAPCVHCRDGAHDECVNPVCGCLADHLGDDNAMRGFKQMKRNVHPDREAEVRGGWK